VQVCRTGLIHFIISIEYSQIQTTPNRQIWPSTKSGFSKNVLCTVIPCQTLCQSVFAPVCTYDHRLQSTTSSAAMQWENTSQYISHTSLHSSNMARRDGVSTHTHTHTLQQAPQQQRYRKDFTMKRSNSSRI
jgi:hypothetical protein